MRGVAALSVVCGHAISARPDMVGPELAEGALTILASGVDIFFVISGFIIATTATAQHNPLDFAFRRALRIFPLYWLVLLAALVSSSWIALAPGDRPALDLGTIFAWTYPNWYLAPAWSLPALLRRRRRCPGDQAGPAVRVFVRCFPPGLLCSLFRRGGGFLLPPVGAEFWCGGCHPLSPEKRTFAFSAPLPRRFRGPVR